MTSRTQTSFSVGKVPAGVWEGTVLAQIDAAFVPTLLHRLEVYKHRFPYDTDEEWAGAWYATARQQQELLMDIGDRIVSEVRALRDGAVTPSEARDPLVDPYTLGLTSLRDVSGAVDTSRLELGDKLTTANELLVEVRDAILAGGTSGEDQLAALQQIIFLLGAV